MPTRADVSVGRRRASEGKLENVRTSMASVAAPGPGYDTIGERKREETGMLRRLDWALILDYDAKERQAPPCLASCSLRQRAARQRVQ